MFNVSDFVTRTVHQFSSFSEGVVLCFRFISHSSTIFSFVALSKSVMFFLVAVFSTGVSREILSFIHSPGDCYTSYSHFPCYNPSCF
jgi:hypothetical protein